MTILLIILACLVVAVIVGTAVATAQKQRATEAVEASKDDAPPSESAA